MMTREPKVIALAPVTPPCFYPAPRYGLTGIYEVIHDRGHRATHEAVLHGKDLFPNCDQCGEKVRFRLIRTAPYIFDDEDFIPET